MCYVSRNMHMCGICSIMCMQSEFMSMLYYVYCISVLIACMLHYVYPCPVHVLCHMYCVPRKVHSGVCSVTHMETYIVLWCVQCISAHIHVVRTLAHMFKCKHVMCALYYVYHVSRSAHAGVFHHVCKCEHV